MHPNLAEEELMAHLMSGETKLVNRYPDCKVLAHKDVFKQMMKFCIQQHPKDFDFIPPTFALPGKELAAFEEYMSRHPDATYIAKPQVGAQGDSICLFKHLKDLPYLVSSKDLVVQRYLDKPLLLDGSSLTLGSMWFVLASNHYRHISVTRGWLGFVL